MFVAMMQVRAVGVGVADGRMGVDMDVPRAFRHIGVIVCVRVVLVVVPMRVHQRFMYVQMGVLFRAQ